MRAKLKQLILNFFSEMLVTSTTASIVAFRLRQSEV